MQTCGLLRTLSALCRLSTAVAGLLGLWVTPAAAQFGDVTVRCIEIDTDGVTGGEAPRVCSGLTAPEGSLVGKPGDIFIETDGAAGSIFWIKDGGTGDDNSGWVLFAVAGSGTFVDTSGTPADNQLAIFTDADTIEGNANLIFDATGLCIGCAAATRLLDIAGAINAPSISASESYKNGLGVSIGTDAPHDIDVSAGWAQSFDTTQEIIFAAQAAKGIDAKWVTGATAGMLGEVDAGPTATLTFSLTASPDTITSDESTFQNCDDLTIETGTILIVGGSTNNGNYEIASCTPTVLTLGEGVLAGDETSTVGEYEVRYVKPNTVYHAFLIELADTEDICASTSEIATDCLSESGYDQYRFLQSLITDATANLRSF